MIFLYVSISLQVIIRHWNDNIFICDTLDNPNWGRRPVPCSLPEATTWTFEPFSGEIVLIRTSHVNAEIFDINMSNMDLLLWPEHGGPNQQFIIITDIAGGSFIKNGGRCITYVPASTSYIRSGCNGSDLQRFEMLPDDFKFQVPEANVPEEIIPEEIIADGSGRISNGRRSSRSDVLSRPRLGRFDRDSRASRNIQPIAPPLITPLPISPTPVTPPPMIIPPTPCNCPPQTVIQPPQTIIRSPQPVVIGGGTKVVTSSSTSKQMSGSSSASMSGSSSASMSGSGTLVRSV